MFDLQYCARAGYAAFFKQVTHMYAPQRIFRAAYAAETVRIKLILI